MKEPQKSEESAVEPLVRDEVSHTPRAWQIAIRDCRLNGNCASCQMLGSTGVQTSQCKENLVNILCFQMSPEGYVLGLGYSGPIVRDTILFT